MKIKLFFITLCIVFTGSFATPISAANANLKWQGYELKVVTVTADQSKISEYCIDPFPADGYLALAVLATADGSKISEDTAKQSSKELLLVDDVGLNTERKIEHYVNDDELALVFYMRNYQQKPVFTLTVSPAEQASGKLIGTVINWQGMDLISVSATNDKATLAREDWPEKGYLLKLVLEKEDETDLEDFSLSQYKHEIVVVDEDQNEYRPVTAYQQTVIPEEYRDQAVPTALKPYVVRAIELIYRIDVDPAPDIDSFTLQKRTLGVLWMDAAIRKAATVPLYEFKPQSPKINTAALFLSNGTVFKRGSEIAIDDVDGAFEIFNPIMKDVRSGLQTLLSGALKITVDPNEASVLMELFLEYESAGSYAPVGWKVGTVSAYNCYLRITAYDAMTKEKISSLRIGVPYGNTISVAQGTETISKSPPQFTDAKKEDKDAFAADLKKFWDSNKK